MCRIAVLLLVLAPGAAEAAGPPPLDRAVQAYEQEVAQARQRLIAAFEKAIAARLAAGDAKGAAQLRARLRGALRALDAGRSLRDPAAALKVDLAPYVGRYVLNDHKVIRVRRDRDRLFLQEPGRANDVELLPVARDRFARADDGRGYAFYRADDGSINSVTCHGDLRDGRRMDHARVLRVQVTVDGRSRLIFQDETVRWLHLEYAAPGRHDEDNQPTLIDGVPWEPVWPDRNGRQNTWQCVLSSVYRGIQPPLPRAPLNVGVAVQDGRGGVYVIDTPCEHNDYTLIVEIHDADGGADRYDLELCLEPVGPEPRTEQPPDLARGLVLNLPFDGNARDASGHDRHGSVHGAAMAADRFGRPDRAYGFSGTDWVSAPAPPRHTDSPMSVSAWVRYDRLWRWWHGAVVAQDRPEDRAWMLAGRANRVVWHRLGSGPNAGASTRLRADVWYHFVATFDGTHHCLYQDAIRIGRKPGGLPALSDQPITIGRRDAEGPNNALFLKGSIDDVRIYDRALTREEVAALYHEGDFDVVPLVEAARSGDRDQVERLLVQLAAEGGDINAGTKNDGSALCVAAGAGHTEAVQLLLRQGADPNLADPSGRSPLHAAVETGALPVVKALLAAKARPAPIDADGRSPLHLAAALGREDLVRALLAAGAPANAADARGNTPLHRAAAYGRDGVIRVLLAAGADARTTNRQDETPAQVAQEFGKPRTAARLQQAAERGPGEKPGDF
jgi:hypothetical protein